MITTEQRGAGTVLVRYGQEIGRFGRFASGEEVRFSSSQPAFSARELREIADILERRSVDDRLG